MPPVIEDEIAKHGFENNWWNELNQLPRRLNGLAAMCPKGIVSGRHSARASPAGELIGAVALFRSDSLLFQPSVRFEYLAAQSIGAPEDGTSCGVKQNRNLACRKAGGRMAPEFFVTFRGPIILHHA